MINLSGNSTYSNSNSFATEDRQVRSLPLWFRRSVPGLDWTLVRGL